MPTNKRFLYVSALLMISIALAGVTTVRAQSILDGKIVGTITDDKGEPLPGATLEVTSPALIGKRAAVTSARGTYAFLKLPGGTYGSRRRCPTSRPSFRRTSS